MEDISRKIDDLSAMMSRLNHAHEHLALLAAQQTQTQTQTQTPPSKPPPSSDSPEETSNYSKYGRRKAHSASNGQEHEGIEHSLMTQVALAAQALPGVVVKDPHSKMAVEMAPVLDTLKHTIEIQRKENEVNARTNSFSKPLPPGTKARDLPRPSTDRVLECLRMAQGALYPFHLACPLLLD